MRIASALRPPHACIEVRTIEKVLIYTQTIHPIGPRSCKQAILELRFFIPSRAAVHVMHLASGRKPSWNRAGSSCKSLMVHFASSLMCCTVSNSQHVCPAFCAFTALIAKSQHVCPAFCAFAVLISKSPHVCPVLALFP
eukprot:856335-Karenia_brevis.AAC.1